MADEDILFKADVDDKTLEFFQRFDANLDRVANAAESGFEEVDRRVKQTGKEIGALSGIVAGLTVKLLDLGYKGAQALIGFLKEATTLRARVDVLGVTLEGIGSRAGYTTDQIAEVENGLKDLGITTQAARQSLVLMARANIDWSEASKLARIAQNSAVVAGINSSQAFERLIRGIQKMEPELLDELGITLRRSDAYDKLAETLGKSAKALTDTEKQQAILNEIYRQSEVVAGSYEAAMGNVGKQVTSLPRHIEELQLALGEAFQPAYSQQVEFMTEKLKELRQWVVDNQDAIQKFGEDIAKAMEVAFNLLDKAISTIGKIPETVERAGVSLAKLLSTMDDAQVEQQAAQNVTAQRFGQFISIIVGVVAGGIKVLSEFTGYVVDMVKAVGIVISGGDATAIVDRMTERIRNFGDNVRTATQEATIEAAKMFGVIQEEAPPATEAAEQTAAAVQDIGDSASDSIDALKKIDDAFKSLKAKMEEDVYQRNTQEFRRQAQEALQNSFRIEDIERSHQERLEQIRKEGEQRRQELDEQNNEKLMQLHEQHNENAIKIEEDHQRRIKEIQENFERDATELARQRDAIGLLRLMRNKQFELEQERKSAEERRKENDKNFQKSLADLRDSMQKQEREFEQGLKDQLEQAEEARTQQYEALNRQLERERQLREMQRQWEEEDRQRAYEKELQELAEQFADMEGITQDGLDDIITAWEEYFGDLSELRDDIREVQAEMASMSFGPGGNYSLYGKSGSSTPATTPSERYNRDSRFRGKNSGDAGVFGQAGQISSQLAGRQVSPAMFTPQQVSPLPSAKPRGVERREIIVKAEGFSPEVERQVVAVLTEIERNRG